MPGFPSRAPDLMTERLAPPRGRLRVVIDTDTDTANEIDDQYALARALFSPEKLDVLAVMAEPFSFAHHLPGLRVAEAATAIVDLAKSQGGPLFIAALGCVTNIASAILMAPEIIRDIVVVWTSGYRSDAPHTNRPSLNTVQVLPASRRLFDCGVPRLSLRQPCRRAAQAVAARDGAVRAGTRRDR